MVAPPSRILVLVSYISCFWVQKHQLLGSGVLDPHQLQKYNLPHIPQMYIGFLSASHEVLSSCIVCDFQGRNSNFTTKK